MSEKLVGINVLVHRLPEANFELLSTVFRYLVQVVACQDRNLMGVKNREFAQPETFITTS